MTQTGRKRKGKRNLKENNEREREREREKERKREKEEEKGKARGALQLFQSPRLKIEPKAKTRNGKTMATSIALGVTTNHNNVTTKCNDSGINISLAMDSNAPTVNSESLIQINASFTEPSNLNMVSSKFCLFPFSSLEIYSCCQFFTTHLSSLFLRALHCCGDLCRCLDLPAPICYAALGAVHQLILFVLILGSSCCLKAEVY